MQEEEFTILLTDEEGSEIEGELEGFDDAELLDKVFKLFLERNGMA